jgi:hypothetical protein
VGFLAPRGWHADRQRTGDADGQVTFIAPDRRGRIYVEVNSCIACVDEGDVQHASRTEVPAPDAVIGQYDAAHKHRVSQATIAFTTQAPHGYVAPARLTVRKADGAIIGYVVVETTLPKRDAASADQIVKSLKGRGL